MPSPSSRSRKTWTVHGPRTPSASTTRRPKALSSGWSITSPLIDSPPRDSIIVRGIAFRQRPPKSDSVSIESSGPSISRWTIVGSRTYSTKNSAARASSARWIDRAPEPCRGLTRTGKDSIGSPGSAVGGLGSPRSNSSRWVSYLSYVARAMSGSGTSAGSSPAARATASTSMSRSVSGTTTPTPKRSHSSRRAGTYEGSSIRGTAQR